MHSTSRALALAALGALSAACSDPFTLPRAQQPNVVDTVTLFAIDGTPIGLPGAYNLLLGQAIRTDRSADFDVAVNVRGDTAVLLPTGALGFDDQSGVRRMSVAFDQVREAPTEGYTRDAPVPVGVGDVVVIRSRPVACFGATLFLYAKAEVLVVALPERAVTLQLLVDRNCGYRGLEPGTPAR